MWRAAKSAGKSLPSGGAFTDLENVATGHVVVIEHVALKQYLLIPTREVIFLRHVDADKGGASNLFLLTCLLSRQFGLGFSDRQVFRFVQYLFCCRRFVRLLLRRLRLVHRGLSRMCTHGGKFLSRVCLCLYLSLWKSLSHRLSITQISQVLDRRYNEPRRDCDSSAEFHFQLAGAEQVSSAKLCQDFQPGILGSRRCAFPKGCQRR